jgi:phage-related protein
LGATGNVIGTVWDGIGTAISTAWGVIDPIFPSNWDFIDGYIIPIFQLIAAVAEIVFVSIGRIIQWAWREVISPVFDAIWSFIRAT